MKRLSKLLPAALFVFICTPLLLAQPGEMTQAQRELADYIRKNYTKSEVLTPMREGVYEDVRPYIPNKRGNQIDETSDTYDTVDWLIKNVANNNGRVGVYGISYPGFYTSMAGIDGHPAVKAISPQAPVSDWFHGDDNHHNGALFLAQNFSFFTGFGQPRPTPTSNNTYLKQFNFGTQDGYKYYLAMGGLKNSGDAFEKQLGFRLKFWDQMMQ